MLGTSWYGPQCFVDDSLGARSIAWQFHPEVTTETYNRWIDDDEGMIRAAGADPDELRRQSLANAARSRNAAYQLTDDALEYLGVALSIRGLTATPHAPHRPATRRDFGPLRWPLTSANEAPRKKCRKLAPICCEGPHPGVQWHKI